MKQITYSRVFTVVLAVFALKGFAQLPANDASWQLQKQDNFNSYNSADWHATYSWGNTNNGLEWNDPANLLYNSGWLEIKCEKLTTPIPCTGCTYSQYYYKSGAIFSKFQYKYGYYEISAKLPVGRGLWPAFWELGIGPAASPCNYYNEIDIAENGGGQSISGQEMGFNMHHKAPPACTWWSLSGGTIPPGVVVGDITQEHKYAALWEPGKVTYFFDDNPIRVVEDAVHVPSNPLSTIINFAVDPWTQPDASTNFPAYFKINYLNISQLKQDCSTNENICTFNKSTYNYAVKKSVTISGCSNTIKTSDEVKFYATDYILLDSGLELQADGTGTFLAYMTQCPN
ncbi:MAG: endo-beta,3-glucanase [Bacteroidetes bacterium]|jgi:beta-glucanase (GH16 family)|nr:endo-beta,3-glucanase [Bacteroidota bacterium]